MSDDGLLFHSALELARMVRAREVSPVELAELALDRIERLDGRLNTFVTVDADGALAAAKDAERRVTAVGEELPPFLGVPTAIKDLHLTAGLRTTFCTATMADFVPPIDSEHVGRLRAAGFVFIGKTNSPELGSVPYTEPLLHGPCRNPWDTDRTPGGSSGGAGAAVAAGLIPVADASDGGGSIRIPASACGVFGLKPARGRISNAPLFGDIYLGISGPGPISRFVADAAAMLDVEAGYAPGDPHWAPPPAGSFLEAARSAPGTLRIGLVLESPLPGRSADPQVLREAEAFGALLESLGHDVEPLALPIDERLAEDFTTVWTAGIAANPIPDETMEPMNQALAAVGAAASAVELMRAFTSMQAQARAIVTTCLAYDVVVMPTLAQLPPAIGAFADLEPMAAFAAAGDFVGFTPVANMTGQPAASLPVGWSDEGLPIGMMVMGRPADEATLLRLAAQVETATDWPSRRPPVA